MEVAQDPGVARLEVTQTLRGLGMVRMCVVGTHVHRRPTWKVDLLAVVELDRIVLQGDQFEMDDVGLI